jgi:hypothetical protein
MFTDYIILLSTIPFSVGKNYLHFKILKKRKPKIGVFNNHI